MLQALGSCAMLMFSFGHHMYELGLVAVVHCIIRRDSINNYLTLRTTHWIRMNRKVD